MAFEGMHGVAPGLIFGGRNANPILYEIMEQYHKDCFLNYDNSYNLKTIVQRTTQVLLSHGLVLDCNRKQEIEGIVIYPKIVFCPDKKAIEQQQIDERTYTIHHYNASWCTPEHKRRLKNPIWKLFFQVCAFLGKVMGKLLGPKLWNEMKRKYLQKLYRFLQGQ
jgi:hypothetical protein